MTASAKTPLKDPLDALRVRGTLVLFGGASGQVPSFDLQQLNAQGSLTVTRPKIDDFLLDAEERRWRSEELFRLVADGRLKVNIGARFPLGHAAEAHAALEARATSGKTPAPRWGTDGLWSLSFIQSPVAPFALKADPGPAAGT